MKTSDITACVVDHGAYLPLARRLAKDYGRVLYYTPWEEAYPTVNRCCIGDGFEDIERCDDIWTVKDEIDLFVFPDILHGGLQEELVRQGCRVWGSKNGCELETDRLLFLKTLQDTNLELPPMIEVRGVTELRQELRDKTDQYIKISRFRGTMETYHWRSYDEDRCWLDALAVKLGPLADLLRFLVCEPIDTDIEIGGDTYCIDGRYPSHMIEGYEWKDKSAFGRIKRREEMAECIQAVQEAFAPVLASYAYRNYFSCEIRVKDDRFYFLDPCCRGPLPLTGSQCALYQNLSEIIWEGADGNVVEPEFDDTYCCECILSTSGDPRTWSAIRVPEELSDAMKISDCCCVDNQILARPPDDTHESREIGWLVATGKTPREAVQNQLDLAKQLPDGICAATESLANLMSEIAEAESKGIEFTPLSLPKPEETIDKD